MNKKADIWISAILYFALGIIILTLVLAATLPVIEQLKDKNIIIPTKNLMSDLDENLRSIYREGPGSQRTLELTIKKGNFKIDDTNNLITFNLESKFQESEINTTINSGYLTILTTETPQKDIYNVKLELNYSTTLNLASNISQISGSNIFLLKNIGGTTIPTIKITEI